jgi:hypothetical protein
MNEKRVIHQEQAPLLQTKDTYSMKGGPNMINEEIHGAKQL